MIFKISRSISQLMTIAIAGFVFGLCLVGGLSAGFWLALWNATR
jgi:hypothetical protein